MRSQVRLVLLLVLLAASIGCTPATSAPLPTPTVANPLDGLFQYNSLDNIDPIDFPEPSGLVFHPERGTLFVVGDEGDLAEIRPDGTVVRAGEIEKADFEGITHDPASGLLYAVTEGDATIVELDPTDFTITRIFTIDPVFSETTLLRSGDNHVEAITFVPNLDLPEGGTFFLANRGFKADGRRSASALLEVVVPLQRSGSESTPARIVNYFPLDVADLSGLHYDSASDRLYLLSDTNNALLELSRQGEVLRTYAFPGRDQEGVTLDRDGFLYFAQDSGGIIKTGWRRESLP